MGPEKIHTCTKIGCWNFFFFWGGGGWVSIAKCLNGKYGTNLEIPVGKVGGRKPNNHLAVEIWIFSGTTQ